MNMNFLEAVRVSGKLNEMGGLIAIDAKVLAGLLYNATGAALMIDRDNAQKQGDEEICIAVGDLWRDIEAVVADFAKRYESDTN